MFLPCRKCQGEGREIRMGTVYEPGCGHPHKGEVDRGACFECHGSGTAICESRGCDEPAVAFDDDGLALCEDCLSESLMAQAVTEDNWEDDHL
jgi:hypothetical protein